MAMMEKSMPPFFAICSVNKLLPLRLPRALPRMATTPSEIVITGLIAKISPIVPLRLEIGPKDIEKNQCVLVRRDNREKVFVSLDNLEEEVPKALEQVRQGMYDKALSRRENMTYTAKSLSELKEIAENKPGLIKAMWCGELECEEKLKEEAGVTSRCMPFEQEEISDTCVCCGKKAKTMVVWGKAY